MNLRRAAAVLCAAAVTFAAAVRADAGPFDPALRFRVLTTPHFVIYFHQQEEALAAALAARAEEIHASLVPLLGGEPDARTHVVLVHQDDLPNGTAAVLPQNTIVIHAAPPAGVSFLGNTSDWLREVFTHEYAHILHLDRSRGWASVARAIFGRSPIAFPNLTLPLWQIEGLATFAESRLGEGRLHARDFTALVDRAAVEGRFEPLDRVNGGLVDWPGPQGWYAYGALFHEYLAERYGADAVRRLADRTSGRVPYFTWGAFKSELGRSLGELWQDFEQARRAAHTQAGGLAGERLTHLGFSVSAPRLDRDGAVLFTAATPDGLPKVRRLPLEGGKTEELFERFGGAGLAIAGDLVIFDQLELVRNTGLASDLYAYERSTGRTRRLTREARLVDPDLSPDGSRLAVVQIVPGGRQLLILDAAALLRASSPATPGRLPVLARVGEPGDVFAGPRWSPDGTQLAVERGPLPSSIVVLTGTGAVLTQLRVSDGRHVTPAWSPDGRLLFAADDERSTFQVFAASRQDDGSAWSVVQLTRAPGGLRDPLPLDDGALVGVGYGVDGFDLHRLRAEDQLNVPVPLQPVPSRARAEESAIPQGAEYQPWPTLLPRGWTPLVERRDGRWRVGASTYGVDVLGRHATTATATWAVSGGPENGDRLLSPARPDWSAACAYLRWRPAWTIDVSDRASIFDVFTNGGDVVPVVQRDREVNAGVLFPIRRTTKALAFRGMFHHGHVTARSAIDEAQATRAGVRASFSAVTARRYGYSISSEDGMAFALTGEWFRPAFGSDGRADAITADWRGYFSPGDTHIVIALRAAGAASFGDEQTRRAFRLGGADGNAALGSFDSDSISLLRGFQDGAFAGTRVALANLELRMPLWWPQRGLGTWPLFLRNVHAAAFVDVGHAWSAAGRWSDRKIGAGVELSADFVAVFGAPLTVTAGAAWGRDGARRAARGAEIYLRLGQAF